MSRRQPLLITLAVTCVMALGVAVSLTPHAASAQDQPDAAFWEMFDRHHPDLAGQGPELWREATDKAKERVDGDDDARFESMRRLIFQALVQSKLDQRPDQASDEGRQAALAMFKRHVETLDRLNAKAPEDLTPEELRELIRASVGAAQYINEGRIEALELQVAELTGELERMQTQLSELAYKVESGDGGSGDSSDDAGSGTAQAASKSDYRAYLKYNKIDTGDDNNHDRSAVRVVGAIQNRTDKPASFRFKIIPQRSNGESIGLKTVTTPQLKRMEVYEIDERVPVSHSAYVRKVDLQSVEVVE